MNMNNEILHVKIEDIVPNRFQPREHFSDDGIEELAKSIKEHGIIQPLVLRRLGEKFEIIAGERRYKAACLAGLTEVPAILTEMDDNKSAEVALVENIQRRNLTAIEEAKSYKAILDQGEKNQSQLAESLGISQSQVANKLRLLNLCDEVQEALMTQKISERHARALLAINDPAEQKKWLDRILTERLTVRQLNNELKNVVDTTEENNDVPILNIKPNLDMIRKNAIDIISVEEPKNLDNILVADQGIKQIDEERKQEEKKEEPVIEEPKVNTNRFFNFLEDEGANMNMERPEENTFTNIFGNANLLDSTIPSNVETTSNMESISTPINEVTPAVQPSVEPAPSMDPASAPINPFNMGAPIEPSVQAAPSMDQTSAPINPFNMAAPIEPSIQPAPSIEPASTPINPINEVTPVAQPSVEMPEETFNPFMMNEPVVSSTPIVEPQVMPSVNPVEMIEPQSNVTPVTPAVATSYNPFIASEPIANSEPANNPFMMNETVASNPPLPVEPQQPVNVEPNIIVTPPTAGIIDPMSMVNNLDPNREEQKVVVQQNNLTEAIGQFRELVRSLEQKGFYINLEEIALPDGYKLNIDIKG